MLRFRRWKKKGKVATQRDWEALRKKPQGREPKDKDQGERDPEGDTNWGKPILDSVVKI